MEELSLEERSILQRAAGILGTTGESLLRAVVTVPATSGSSLRGLNPPSPSGQITGGLTPGPSIDFQRRMHSTVPQLTHSFIGHGDNATFVGFPDTLQHQRTAASLPSGAWPHGFHPHPGFGAARPWTVEPPNWTNGSFESAMIGSMPSQADTPPFFSAQIGQEAASRSSPPDSYAGYEDPEPHIASQPSPPVFGPRPPPDHMLVDQVMIPRAPHAQHMNASQRHETTRWKRPRACIRCSLQRVKVETLHRTCCERFLTTVTSATTKGARMGVVTGAPELVTPGVHI